MLPRRQNVEYDATHHGEYFYIRTNDEAKNFRLMRTRGERSFGENWHEVIPARADVTIEGVDSFEDHLAVYERERGLEKICIRDGSGAFSHYIEFPEPVYTVSATGNAEYKTNLLRFNYTSLVTPIVRVRLQRANARARVEEAIRSARRLRRVAISIRADLRQSARWRRSADFVGLSQGL